MQPVPPDGFELVVGVGVECVVVGDGVECVVVGDGAGVECVVVVGVGVTCVVVVDVVVGIVVVVAVVCVVWCVLALWCGLAGFFAVVLVVGVVAVVSGWADFVVLVDEEAPQPAAIRASDTEVTHRMGSRLNRILTKHDASGAICFPRNYGIPTSELSPTMNR
jgi:hypothetical protein